MIKILNFNSLILFFALLTGIQVSQAQNQTGFPFQDPSKPIDERVTDLIARLTLEEKAQQMMNAAPGIERLGILPYDWWSEALHGVARTGKATVFPQNIGLGATFDEDLMLKIGEAVSDEAWAKFNVAQKLNNYTRYSGITFYAPNINIFRDPRWGRGQETFGEDPYLTGRLGLQYVKGMQGNDPKYLKTAACAKHYVVHSGPEAVRHAFNATPSRKDFFETYSPAFKTLVTEGKVESVMCAYNRTFGKACCGSSYLLTDLLRNEWGFKGFVTTDCGAIHNFYRYHGVSADQAEACALAIKSGVNLDCGDEFSKLPEAVKRGLITEKEVDQALATLLKTRFKLGLFDPVNNNPYSKIGTEVIGSEKHRQLALEAATKSVVMLQNKNNILPLRKDLKTLYVIGPYATSQDVLLGNYNGVNDQLTTILEGVVSKVSLGTSVNYRAGVVQGAVNQNPADWAGSEAMEADFIIAVFGISGVYEGEEGEAILSSTSGDRLDLGLPQNQLDYLRSLRKKGKKPIILVLTGGSPICTPELTELADAILFAWYPGQEGGKAVADIIFGDANPSGRLPITFPKSIYQLPAFQDYDMKGRSYKYMEEEPLYPFGFGLSFNQYEYSDLNLNKSQIRKGESVMVTVNVTNKGKIAGDEVVQLYLTDIQTSCPAPAFALENFKRIALAPGESKTVTFNITPEMMELILNDGNS
ncbi:MAG: glycoside hydrolase family 3 protein, partial [Bacteroidales bacterium]|nr:glycoside hydrolase family 3 protein [Bacteroidales bacterium]